MTKRMHSHRKAGNRKQQAVYLIEQQLKIRYFFDSLKRIGFANSEAEPNLDHLILKKLKLDDGTDETYTRYTEIIDAHIGMVANNPPGSVPHAVKVYKLLKALRNKEKNKIPHATARTATTRV
jgi:hypothetical protein